MSGWRERAAAIARWRTDAVVAMLVAAADEELAGVTAEPSEEGVTLTGRGLRRRALDEGALRNVVLLLAGRR